MYNVQLSRHKLFVSQRVLCYVISLDLININCLSYLNDSCKFFFILPSNSKQTISYRQENISRRGCYLTLISSLKCINKHIVIDTKKPLKYNIWSKDLSINFFFNRHTLLFINTYLDANEKYFICRHRQEASA